MPMRSVQHRARTGGRWLALAILILVGLTAAWASLRPAPGPDWQTAPIVRGDIEASVTAIGTLQPVRSVDVGAQVSGQITQIHVQAGETVRKGQLLAEIDASVLAATVEAGRAQMGALRAQLDDAKAQAELAARQHDRQRRLAKAQAASQDDLETATAAHKSAVARVAQYEAQIRQTAASLSADEARLSYTRIYAPISGVVTGVDVKEGQTLNATYQTPTVLRIADLSRMTVWTDVSEADIHHVKTGMGPYFTTLGGDRRCWRGTVRQVLPAPPVQPADASGGAGSAAQAAKAVQYTALFDVDNPDGALMPQMTAQVSVVAASARGVLIVPLAALKPVEDGDTHEVRILAERSPDQVVEIRCVHLGVRDRLRAEVLQGLAEGEQVITGGVPQATRPRRFRW